MKLSQVKKEELSCLTLEQKASIVYGAHYEDPGCVDVALILGSSQKNAMVRALGAAERYRTGCTKYLIPSGGVENTFDGVRMTEAEFMKELLLSHGVPREAILMENEATTTKENFIYGVLQLNRHLRIENVKRMGVITSAFHMRRSMGLAKLFLPSTVTAVAMPAETVKDPVAYVQTEYGAYWTEREIPLLWELIAKGLMDDIGF